MIVNCKRENIQVLFRKFRIVSVRFETGSKHRNKSKKKSFGFTKQTETNAKQILFRFVSVRTEIFYFSFRGHPSVNRGHKSAGIYAMKVSVDAPKLFSFRHKYTISLNIHNFLLPSADAHASPDNNYLSLLLKIKIFALVSTSRKMD